jgi:hypothetical protein
MNSEILERNRQRNIVLVNSWWQKSFTVQRSPGAIAV